MIMMLMMMIMMRGAGSNVVFFWKLQGKSIMNIERESDGGLRHTHTPTIDRHIQTLRKHSNNNKENNVWHSKANRSEYCKGQEEKKRSFAPVFSVFVVSHWRQLHSAFSIQHFFAHFNSNIHFNWFRQFFKVKIR